ncbi:hypothetical protein M407DRAFT_25560 [Tulasnella calospora MUT 4182]|uniref:Uncharacterized protein n=1 Tax=Tulasnella calospora MUT 4182 TaxID=1051891 RepID=A0A0C3LUN8_9AGAM|nr:hypothetical protein M407DRAFT_25560 [Tulasnella calospora MUT 4182]
MEFALQTPSPSSRPEPMTSRTSSQVAFSMQRTRLFSTTELEPSRSRTFTPTISGSFIVRAGAAPQATLVT